MVPDVKSILLDNVALNTGAAGTYLIGNQYDLRGSVQALNQADVDFEDLYLVCRVRTTATSGGAATLQLSVATDDTAAISTTTSSIHFRSDTYTLAQLTAGATLFSIKLPRHLVGYERYLGILQITGTAAFTGGALDVLFTTNSGRYIAYPDGWTGSYPAA